SYIDEVTGREIIEESVKMLYKLVGYQEIEANTFEPIYIQTHKLGYKSHKGQLHEYDLSNMSNSSIFSENNVSEEHITKGQETINIKKEVRPVYLFEEGHGFINPEYAFLPSINSFGNVSNNYSNSNFTDLLVKENKW